MSENFNKIVIDDTEYSTTYTKKFLKRKKYQASNPKFVNAFIPGTIKDVFIKEGDNLKIGDPVLILEAMKMKNSVFAPIDGKVKKIFVKAGEKVGREQLLVEFE